MTMKQRRYIVFWQDEIVLEVIDEPGPLVSRAGPPPCPDEKPVIHPFLSATAYVPEHESTLREALERSGSLAEYLDILRELGFRVVEQTRGQ
jgi:hypothetical protein